jgi:AraC-like DNA-binding protein
MIVTRNLLRLTDDGWREMAKNAGYRVIQLARNLGCSVEQLERFFKRYKGMTPHDWMTRSRVTKGADSLIAGKPVKEAAADAGYKTPAHFSREFKNVYGMTPTQMAYSVVPGRGSPRPYV